jgi:arsenate reductase (thioredoxin)
MRIEQARRADLAGIRWLLEYERLPASNSEHDGVQSAVSVFSSLDGETMTQRPYNVLFLCTGNSARSILAEVLINRWGAGKFAGYSAGSFPKGEVNPLTLQFLRQVNLPTEGLRSKSWDEFARPRAPPLDFVITVCDQAAGEVCPVWPGQPITAHWGVQDPAAAEGSTEAKLAVFNKVFRELEARIKIFCSLPLASLDHVRIKERVDEIGRTDAD